MQADDLMTCYWRFKNREDVSHDLMKHKINEILLVSTFYDAFVFEQDGVLSERIYSEYGQLGLSFPPRVMNVPTGADALKALETRKFDLVITMTRTGDISPFDLNRMIKERYPGMPVILLLNNQMDMVQVEAKRYRMAEFDEVFLWTGDSGVFLAMIKGIEDRLNLEHDTRHGLVRVILVIEDSIAHYSKFLPILYTQLVKQTQQLINEELTGAYRRLRMSMRPKVILAHDFAAAEAFYREYKDYLISIVTDVQYERAGTVDDEAGVRFISMVREDRCTVPVLLQSLDQGNAAKAGALGARFLNKSSPQLLSELRDFITSELGFGDFIFRREDRSEVARASTMADFVALLRVVPDASILYHASNNHFSGWLIAHGEVAYARKLQPLRVQDFRDTPHLRQLLVDVFHEVESSRTRGRVVSASGRETLDRERIVRLRDGSLGGKGRGLAFLNALLYALDYPKRFPGVDVTLPGTAIVGTDEFDEFLSRNRIGVEITLRPDEAIRERFLAGELSDELMRRLAALVEHVEYPLAVRSSGLLEDSQSSPFAGVYKTYMLPNRARDSRDRLADLAAAIKLVFASVFEESAREYIVGADYKVEEEKMAVVIQEIAGRQHLDWFYPEVSGVAQSHNFYPTGQLRPSDGLASVALGLGKSVMEGRNVLRFCPRYPAFEILSHEELVRGSQREFWAIRLDSPARGFVHGEEGTLARLSLKTAEEHGTLRAVGSVWDRENERLVDDLSRAGPRIVTFANLLKYGEFPLPALLADLLDIGEQALGLPVEIEFAANVSVGPRGMHRPAFYPLQIRPLHVEHETVEVVARKRGADGPDALLYTEEAMGNGNVQDLTDIVFVDPDWFATTETLEIQREVQQFNHRMREERRGYILIGPGRWGSRDRFLGVPVAWGDLSEARLIVEMDLPEFRVEASQGTHFFHNMIARNVGYLKVRCDTETAWIDWERIRALPEVGRSPHCVHVRSPLPLRVMLDGKSGRAVVE
jgi:hypothetical protein